MRLLGGMQCCLEEEQRPLNIFVGGSCMRTTPNNAECHDFRSVIQSPSQEHSGNLFVPHDLKVDKAPAGLSVLSSEGADECDGFSLTWSADSTKSQKAARLIASVGEGIRVGTIQLRIPSCGFFTNALCTKINDIVASLSHDSFS